MAAKTLPAPADFASQLEALQTQMQSQTEAVEAERAALVETRQRFRDAFGLQSTPEKVAPVRKVKTGGKKNEHTAGELVEQILKASKVPLDIGEIAVSLMKAGYVTKSDTDVFRTSVYLKVNKLVNENHVKVVGERPNTKYEWKGKR